MLTQHQMDRLCASPSHLFSQKEYLCLPNFVVIGSDVMEEKPCTLFMVDRVYGWNNFNRSYSLCLFDAANKPTVGVWQNNYLAIYLDIPVGYMRMRFLAKSKPEFTENINSNNSKRYQFFVDVSSDGINWKLYGKGKCGC